MVGDGDHSEHVAQVVQAGERRAVHTEHRAVLRDLELHPLGPGLADVAPEALAATATVRDERRARPARRLARIGVVGAVHQQAVGRDERHELPESLLHGLEVGVHLGVVVLDGRQDHALRPVMQELRALVEERRLVFVPLDDELVPPPEAEGAAEVLQHPSDEERGIAAARRQRPRHEPGGRRLAVRPRHHDRMPPFQEQSPDRLRHAGVRNAALDRRHRLGVRLRRDVADHHQVGPVVEVIRPVPLEDADTLVEQHRAHGGVDRLVRTAHIVPGVGQEAGERTHPRAADADEMDALHGWAWRREGHRGAGPSGSAAARQVRRRRRGVTGRPGSRRGSRR